MKIVLTGGGTGGSVTPLLALAEEIKKSYPSSELLFIGTHKGPEGALVREQGIPFKSISSGKLRRYADWRNTTDLLLIFYGFLQSLVFFLKYQPDVVLGAGGYVEVPVMWAAQLTGAHVGVHQQDVDAGLANRLVAPIAESITVAYPYPGLPFPQSKVTVTGNPVRSVITKGHRDKARERFHLDGKPVLLVMGGGTGAQGINDLLSKSLTDLLKMCQVLHVTGKDKTSAGSHERYHAFSFLSGHDLADAYAACDLVIARAGLSTITECIAIQKPTVLIPLPESHQESNAKYFAERGAFIIFPQSSAPERFVAMIESMLKDTKQREALQRALQALATPEATQKVLEAHLKRVEGIREKKEV